MYYITLYLHISLKRKGKLRSSSYSLSDNVYVMIYRRYDLMSFSRGFQRSIWKPQSFVSSVSTMFSSQLMQRGLLWKNDQFPNDTEYFTEFPNWIYLSGFQALLARASNILLSRPKTFNFMSTPIDYLSTHLTILGTMHLDFLSNFLSIFLLLICYLSVYISIYLSIYLLIYLCIYLLWNVKRKLQV